MHEIDRAIKMVCGRHPNSFLDLFYGRDRDVKLIGVEDTQLQIPEHRADKIWRVHDGKKEGCLLFEAILQPDRRSFRGINLKNDDEQRSELKGVAAIVASRKFAEELIIQTLKLELSMIREKTIFSEWFRKRQIPLGVETMAALSR